ncbi:MAG: 23S rRNA (guanosine(2251)-2'-O)-methyltransferase RlmB [Deltaproteobacteria bacterium]|nr:23S rRNA (guanosine(2251)-2'-O)-methyltransferase RlmB [Deltaproteobacteria bacterium]
MNSQENPYPGKSPQLDPWFPWCAGGHYRRACPYQRDLGCRRKKSSPDRGNPSDGEGEKHPCSYCELSRLTDTRPRSQALLIALDHITDEGNMGAIIRTALFFGANGLIIPKDRSAGITANVVKRSSGAWMHLPIARVVNLGRALDTLNKNGYWIIGTSGEGRESIYNFDWNRDVVLVLGNEQKGLSQSVGKRCHEIVGIPVSGPAESLNVAVACGVILSEVTRQRKAEKLEHRENF